MEVVGEAADWATTLAQAPLSRADMLLAEWDLLPGSPNAALSELRRACPATLVIILLAPGAAAQVSDLKERQARLWAAIKEMDELPPPLVISTMERLTNLVEQAEPILQAAPMEEPSVAFHPPRPFTGEDGSPISTKP